MDLCSSIKSKTVYFAAIGLISTITACGGGGSSSSSGQAQEADPVTEVSTDCVATNNIIEIAEGASCDITATLVSDFNLNSSSINSGDTASCANSRISLPALTSTSLTVNGLTIQCAP